MQGRLIAGLMLAVAAVGVAEAASPRWVTGPPYFTTTGIPVGWYVDQPLYFTDAGDLSASVNHAAADAMVAAAAAVWNVPTARIVLQQGGTLAEHVSGANVYVGSNGLVFPADVESTNYAAVQIAVIYDSDGSVTDLLLGGGASDPSGCRQNGVTESVDSITPAGTIEHAVLILNGLCTGSDPEQQLQMQYQLERAFGRVLGLGWSQLNDNVFTGTPQPTYMQVLNWPIMHPIDVICGLYTYQCLPEPFTLRDDDVSSISSLYPVTSGSVGPGKVVTSTSGNLVSGYVQFPSGEGMSGVNVVMRRREVPAQYLETWDDVSAVTGGLTQQNSGNPVTPKPTDMAGSQGAAGVILDPDSRLNESSIGYFRIGVAPYLPGVTFQDELFRTEAINPLYTGEYAISPYPVSTVVPSGDVVTDVFTGFEGVGRWFAIAAANAANGCGTGGDGTAAAPVAPAAGGWWTDVSCEPNASATLYGHAAWMALPVQANRSLTVEVTAWDESGAATANKMRPVIGVWHAADAINSLPTVAAAATAFNSVSTGMTTVGAQSVVADTLRIAIADERGDGRPDYAYQARVLYADTIAPAVSGAGAVVTIAGMGFRPGNTVTIGGVAAKVTSWSSTAIVATVPLLKSAPVGMTTAEDVVVTDLSTGGTTVMTGGLEYVYTAPVYTMLLVSGPSGSLPVGLAAVPFAVTLLDVDGVTPLAGVPVVFSATVGSVVWAACGAATCTVTTDANGLASIGVAPSAAGAVTLQAAALGAAQTVSFDGVALVRTAVVAPAMEWLAAGATVSWGATASFTQQGVGAAGVPVSWTVSGAMVLSGTGVTTDASGTVGSVVTAGPLAAGVQATGEACAWTGVCGGFGAVGVDPSQFVVVVESGAGQSVGAAGSLAPLRVEVTDGMGDPVAGAAVAIHQTVSQWVAACPVTGRCAVGPVYEAVVTSGVTDASGMVTVMPLQMAGAEVTDVVVTSGTQGFAALSLEKHP